MDFSKLSGYYGLIFEGAKYTIFGIFEMSGISKIPK